MQEPQVVFFFNINTLFITALTAFVLMLCMEIDALVNINDVILITAHCTKTSLISGQKQPVYLIFLQV